MNKTKILKILTLIIIVIAIFMFIVLFFTNKDKKSDNSKGKKERNASYICKQFIIDSGNFKQIFEQTFIVNSEKIVTDYSNQMIIELKGNDASYNYIKENSKEKLIDTYHENGQLRYSMDVDTTNIINKKISDIIEKMPEKTTCEEVNNK